MKALREYQIPYVGLKIGIHEFNYQIDGKFFEAFEGSLISECQVHVKLELEKKETLFILNFFIDGTVNVVCDRCSENFDKKIFGDYQCIVKFKDARADFTNDDDELIFISREDNFIETADLIYDYINLSLPIQLIHPDKEDGTPGCNPEVLKYLTSSEESTPDDEDPRWAALKKFKNEN